MDTTSGAAREARDHGLARGMGLPAFTATIVNGVVGAGVFTLPAVMAANVGPRAPLAFLACAVAMGAVVLCAADSGRRVPTSGGIYGTVTAGLGPRAGFVTGFVGIWLSSVLSCGGIAAAFADGVGLAVPALAAGVPRAALILGVIGALMLVNLRGVGFAARFLTVATIVKLVPLALFVGVGAWFVTGANFHAGAALGAGDGGLGGGFGRAVIFALFAFSGMETPLSASGEAANPARTVPWAIVLSMGFVLALYVAVQLVAQGLLGADLAAAKDAPLAAAIRTVSPALAVVLAAGATLSRLIWIGSDLLGAPRVLFAFARDRLLPAVFGALDRRQVPRIAIVVHSVLVAVLAISGTFEALAILSGLASTLLYSLACAAAWRLDRRGVGGAGSSPLVPVAALVGIAAMIAIAVQAKPAELFGLAAAAAIALGLYSARRLFAARSAKGQ